MITLKTKCEDCIHHVVCRNLGFARADMEKLKDTTYGNENNCDYDWNAMSQSRHVDITFSCPDFHPKKETLLR